MWAPAKKFEHPGSRVMSVRQNQCYICDLFLLIVLKMESLKLHHLLKLTKKAF